MKQAKLDKKRKYQKACRVSYHHLFEQYLNKNGVERYEPYKDIIGFRWKSTGKCASAAMILMSREFDLLYPELRSRAYR